MKPFNIKVVVMTQRKTIVYKISDLMAQDSYQAQLMAIGSVMIDEAKGSNRYFRLISVEVIDD